MAALTLTTALQAGAALIGGLATFQTAQANAAVMQMNAEINEENAIRAVRRSQVEQEAQDALTRGLLGEQLAGQAASGIAVDQGSPRLTRIAARELGRLDALNIRQAGDIERYNYQAAAESQRVQAGAERRGGAFGLLGSFLEAGSVVTNARPTQRRNYYPPVPTPRPGVLR